MKKVYIKYNPYKLETEITVDGNRLKDNSRLLEKSEPGTRLQEWVEELPDLLIDEYGDREFELLFHGTLMDYEDLVEVFTDAYEKDGKLSVKLDRKAVKETADKEGLLDEVFHEIQRGPFEELRSEDIIDAFEKAKSDDFEVCVVATMSAGKSTLINALLSSKLMPSKQEACTAIITRIKDNDRGVWQAEVYGKDGRLLESHEELTYQTMERLNADENVSVIKVDGNIPFVTSEDVALVLIDTPGPNNSRDPEHRKVQNDFLQKSSKALILYIMEGTFGTNDDNQLLKNVAESMAVGGKQSKDRFIFVVNKMDDRKKEDGDTVQTLERVRTYLKKHGIANPNLFPAAALPALNIRLISGGTDVDEDTIDETEMKVRKLNRNKNLHLEEYASLPTSIRGEINSRMDKAVTEEDKNAEALIHTGIVSLEAAIRQYVQKYSKTAKIKNIVDTFMHKLKEAGCFEEAKQELASNQDESRKIVRQIESIQKNVDSVKLAQDFKGAVDDAVVEISDQAKDVIATIKKKFDARIYREIEKLRGRELQLNEVQTVIEELEKFAEKLEPDFQSDLDELIRENLVRTSEELLKEYRKKLDSLTEEINTSGSLKIRIDPLQLMGGSVHSTGSFAVDSIRKTKKVEDGTEWVENTDKKWYKPWTWFQESGYNRTKYKSVEYVEADVMAQEFLAPLSRGINENGDNAYRYSLKQSKRIAAEFNKEFQRLDHVLKDKLQELKSYATDKEKAEERIKESEKRLKWLENIQGKVESILDI